jgi:hypothetical protein
VTARLFQQAGSRFRFGSGWTTSHSATFSGGSVATTTTDGTFVRMSFTGRAFAFVTTVRAGQPLKVFSYLDGAATGLNEVASPETQRRLQLWTMSWATSDRHVVRYVIDGTNRFDVDAIAVLE